MNSFLDSFEDPIPEYELFAIVECTGENKSCPNYEVTVKRSNRLKKSKLWVRFKYNQMEKV